LLRDRPSPDELEAYRLTDKATSVINKALAMDGAKAS